ncbi:MAG TPA: APC family permease [Candidatus Acidoferrales bacterium]|nr:APC family permease [Candidatus Acidoferrales bacterium]
MSPQDSPPPAAPELRRVLGQWDLILLFVVALTNLNIVPAIAAAGPETVWLSLAALTLFFWPQGIAVIELSHRYPGEGGIYLWSKEVFGNFHGFLSGWCYWTNNVFYIPTLLFYMVGISVYAGGVRFADLGNNRPFVLVTAFLILWFIVWLNIRGLGVGKWLNNFGAIGTIIAAVALSVLAAVHWHLFGVNLSSSDFRIANADWHLASTFGVICFALVGLELASVMGDEIREPRRNLPRAVAWGGIISGLLYVGAILAVLVALPKKDISVVQGILQAVTRMSADIGVAWFVPPLAIALTVAIAGTTSAWISGSARIPFVAGLDRYLPPSLGKVHRRYHTPHVALIVHAVLSCLFIVMSFVGATVEEAYQILLLLAVVLQLIPFLYMFAALLRIALREDCTDAYYKRSTIWLAGLSGFASTALGMIVAFVPPADRHEPPWLFELKMFIGCAFFLGLAAFFFFVYSRRKEREVIRVAAIAPRARGESL